MSKWSVNKFTPLCRICEWKDSRVEEKPPSGGGGTCGGVGAAGEGLVLGMALNGHAGFPHHVASYITIILQYKPQKCYDLQRWTRATIFVIISGSQKSCRLTRCR